MRGQVEAIERALKAGTDCAKVMQLAVSRRGAASSLMAEPLEDHICMHICMHVSDAARDRDRERARGAKHLIDVVHAYLRWARLPLAGRSSGGDLRMLRPAWPLACLDTLACRASLRCTFLRRALDGPAFRGVFSCGSSFSD